MVANINMNADIVQILLGSLTFFTCVMAARTGLPATKATRPAGRPSFAKIGTASAAPLLAKALLPAPAGLPTRCGC